MTLRRKPRRSRNKKRRANEARLAFKRGKREHENKVQSKLAKKYKTGELLEELEKAETAYTRGMFGSNKHVGVAALLRGPEKTDVKVWDLLNDWVASVVKATRRGDAIEMSW